MYFGLILFRPNNVIKNYKKEEQFIISKIESTGFSIMKHYGDAWYPGTLSYVVKGDGNEFYNKFKPIARRMGYPKSLLDGFGCYGEIHKTEDTVNEAADSMFDNTDVLYLD